MATRKRPTTPKRPKLTADGIDNFTFDAAFTQQQQQDLRQRHQSILEKFPTCSFLQPEEREALRTVYGQTIHHRVISGGFDAAGLQGRPEISINPARYFSRDSTEQAMTLIHEMMHCAGSTHPPRGIGDEPGQGGPYYGSPPLQAEMCIANSQTDIDPDLLLNSDCVEIDGQYLLRRVPAARGRPVAEMQAAPAEATCLGSLEPAASPSSWADRQPAFVPRPWSVEEVAQTQRRQPGQSQTSDGPGTAPVRRRPVSGLYRGSNGPSELELRIDVDGTLPLKKVSGDLYQTTGSTVLYSGSFILHSPHISVTEGSVSLVGTGDFSFNMSFPLVRVTIARVSELSQPAPAKATFSDAAGEVGLSFDCPFSSAYFRSVQYEQDQVHGTTPFVSYNAALLESGGPPRVLSVVKAYEEAGIEMQLAGLSNTVAKTSAGTDGRWSDAELHASMVQQFSLWKNEPQWKVWLLVATMHEEGPGLRGIMFDQQGKQRQGCAVFHDVIGGSANDIQRAQLRTYVHELGHCFNLMHSWQKSLAVPPAPNRLAALSWMNYVQNFPGGAAAYWRAFPFRFDQDELTHLRHAFRNNVIMGGLDFGVGAADLELQSFRDPVQDNSGLELRLEARPTYVLGEPVVVELRLSTLDLRGKRVHEKIHPKFGFVQLAIQQPGGQVRTYQPMMDHCFDADLTVLDSTRPALYESAYIGYGRNGFTFDQPGLFRVRGIYHAIDGSEVLSNILQIRIRSPLDRDEDTIADHYMGQDQGQLFYMLGSDSKSLETGKTALETVANDYQQHPLAVYAHLVLGVNAERSFKTLTSEKKLHVRNSQATKSEKLLSLVADKCSGSNPRIDNITLNMSMRRLAQAQQKLGDTDGAQATMTKMVDHFSTQNLNRHVTKQIREDAKRCLGEHE